MAYYTIQSSTPLSSIQLKALQGYGMVRDLSSVVEVNTVREQVLTLLRETLDTMKPIGANRELNPKHLLYHIYSNATYITPPTESGIDRSRVWLEKIFEFNRDIAGNTQISQADKAYYDLVRRDYPVDLNQIVESPVSPRQVSDERTPSLSYGCAQIGPIQGTLSPSIGYDGERLIFFISGVVKDRSENGTYPSYFIFTQACNLHATIDNLVKTLHAPPPEVNGQHIGEIRSTVASRPLLYKTDDGVGSGELIGFTITTDYSYQLGE